MPFVQFRVHPGVGCARMGDSQKAYHLASEFPYFLQEQFPKLRFKPKPRTHPRSFFKKSDGTEDVVAASATGNPVTYNIYDTTPAFQNKFKEAEGIIFPQAARFRVFAYVYGAADSQWPTDGVFEVTTAIADITWKVNIANKKTKKTTAPALDPHPNMTTTDLDTTDLNTNDATLLCKRIRPVAGLPNLAYVFLERDDRDETKVTGRLHVIGNEGELQGSTAPTSLWSDDWYDSAGDGFVQAIVRPKNGGADLRALLGITSASELKYLDYGVAAPQPGTTADINAMPGWVVMALPDYVPDMGHFVSLWDVAMSRAIERIEPGMAAQSGRHKLITTKRELNTYKYLDYNIHIHPQLCLFEDVRFVSGEANNDPESGEVPTDGRAHNIHPNTPPPGPTEAAAMKHGGVRISARTSKADLEDPEKLREADSSKPINTWLKRAVFNRLRMPGNVYAKRRQFVIVLPTEDSDSDGQRRWGSFPRKLGRRMDYDKPAGTRSDKNKLYAFPAYKAHGGNLLKYHGLKDAGNLCGGTKSPPTKGPPGSSFSSAEIELMQWLDDMFWPASVNDMPMLRELAYTPLQHEQFNVWQGPVDDVRRKHVFEVLLAAGVRQAFGEDRDIDQYFADFLAARPLYAPAMIDMAHLNAMLGGSFLPGIEVGREAGVVGNWCLFHGGSIFFPDIRFKPADRENEHKLGTLTKDLAIPWSEDFKACDELFWPTSRPGRTTKGGSGARHDWQITHDKQIPHLVAKGDPDATTGPPLAAAFDAAQKAFNAARRAAAADPSNAALAAAAAAARTTFITARAAAAPYEVKFVMEYWKALGFIRRNASDQFVEEEQTWH